MTGHPLGSILLQDCLITQAQLNKALQIQRQKAEGTGHWQLLGEILVECQFVSYQDLQAALDRQAQLNEIEFFGVCSHPSTRSVFKRVLDISGAIVGLSILLVFLPIIAPAIYLNSPGSIFIYQRRVGLRGKQFKLWRFRTTTPGAECYRLKIGNQKGKKFFDHKDEPQVTWVGGILRRFYLDEMPQFLNVLYGEMSLVGTRPPTLDEIKFYSEKDWQRLAIKPGMTGRWQVSRQKYGMSFDSVLAMDIDYIKRWKYHSDIKILSDTAVHILLGPKRDRIEGLEFTTGENKIGILNVPIDNMSVLELLDKLESGVVLTPNVDHLMKLQKDPEFYENYSLADYKVCDSQILMYASRFLGTPLKEKISGSDFFPAFCEYHRNNPDVTIFLMGGAEGIADRARERVNSRIGREIIVASHSPSFGFEKNEQECLDIVDLINQSRATVLAVGVGAPKQEKWIYNYKNRLTHIRIFLAVGATIDFEAGTLSRAPKWMSHLGVEWIFRITRDPKRLWKRYLVEDLPFFWLLLKQRLGMYTPPSFNPVKPKSPSQLSHRDEMNSTRKP